MRIIIDPRLKYNYASYYLLGIYRLLENKDISYDVKPFLELSYNNLREYNSGFAFVVKYDDGTKRKVFIDTEDMAIIFEDRYQWCDVYGMVNPTKEQVDNFDKLNPIGPEFGVTLGTKFHSILTCMRLYLKGKKLSSIPFKWYLRDYLYTNIRRRKIEMYERHSEVRENYVFHASTLWYDTFTNAETNHYRGEFLRACKKCGLQIEGGLYLLTDSSVTEQFPEYAEYRERYKDFIFEKRLSMDDYILKTKESVMVFNTPSVGGCHGWKLAEYLCMGKAIISMPLSREMPGEGLIHGENIHFIASTEELEEAVAFIKTNVNYRKHLEQGARHYYEEYIAPEKVIKRLLNK